MNMRKKSMGRLLAFVLIMAMVLSLDSTSGVASAAAKKSMKISTKKVTVTAGKSKKVTIKNKPKGAKVVWKSNKKSVAKVNKSGKITGVKKGKAVITAKVTYKKGKKKAKKTFKVNVTVKAKKATTKTTPKPAVKVTQAPAASQQPTAQATATPDPTRQPPLPARTPERDIAQANVVSNGKAEDSNLTDEHTSRYGLKTKDNGMMRTNLSTQDIVDSMGLGWNIGNSLEQTSAASCEKLSAAEQAKLTDAEWVRGYETNAGNAVSTQKMMDGLKKYGINTIRIPIAWSNMMIEEKQADGQTYYRIDEGYFDRVEEIMNYCLNDEMYVIINIHWDNGWWGMFGDKDQSVRDQAMKKYTDFWKQIANRYADYSDRVIFEGANEELGERLNDDWKGSSDQFSFDKFQPGSGNYGTLTKEECYQTVKELNQIFVNTVRESGGNNQYRFLLIPGFNTNIHDTCSSDFSMPEDKWNADVNKLFVSIHYYDPIGWGIAKSISQGYSGYADTWGSVEDYQYMANDFAEAKEAFIDKGYTVIFGEFGVLSVNKDGIPAYFKQFFESCKEYGMLPVMWDEGGHVDRKGTGNAGRAYFIYEDIGDVFLEVSGSPDPELKAEAQKVLTTTGIPQNPVADNQDPLVVATWEGDFMRNTTGSKSVNFDELLKTYGEKFSQGTEESPYFAYFNTDKITINDKYPGLELSANCVSGWWHSHFQLNDWSQLKQPCIRITMHDDDVSQQAQLQLVYSDGNLKDSADMAWRYETDFEQVEWEDGFDYTGEHEMQVPKRDADGNMVLADTAWIGKVLNLNPSYLEAFPDVLITTNTFLGVDFQKVEICDAAYNADGTEYVKPETKE